MDSIDMSDTAEPIAFYEVVGAPGGPFFSPWTVRARLAFALKRVPIRTVEVSSPTTRPAMEQVSS